MTNQNRSSRKKLAGALILLTLFGALVYFFLIPENPPGFYIDESSIAYNAHLISKTGRDEHDEALPLYFRAFGDFKNPVYVYLLAAVFKVTGPSISAARRLSAALGLGAGILLGLLAWKISRRISVAVIIGLSTLLTPWFYESSRLVFEVALYPLATVLFLLALWRASNKPTWKTVDVLYLAATLALLTYSYSIGRLFAPLLAAGLVLFIKRHGWRSVVKVWLAYLVTLVPLIVFARNHPGALGQRFTLLTYITPQSSALDIAREFLVHFLGNLNPWRWLVTGENNVRDHLEGFGSLLAVTVILSLLGVVLVWRRHRREPWWQFIVYGLLVSVIPASLTRSEFPQLRLIAFPVFFHVLMLPALMWLVKTREDASAAHGFGKRVALVVAVGLIVVQGLVFQWFFHLRARDRWYVFDARFPRNVFAVALATGQRPIYLFDPPGNSGYIQAYWYAVLQEMDTKEEFVRLPADQRPPPGALVISTEENCENCNLIAKSINYTLYAVLPSQLGAQAEPLPDDGFGAHIFPENLPSTFAAGTKTRVSVLVTNDSYRWWPVVGRSGTDQYAVVLRNRWLKPDGSVVNDQDGRAHFPYDLEHQDTAGVHIEITAPELPGDYVLEFDVVQEQVAWFGDKGSTRFSQQVRVTPSTRGVQ